MSDFKVGSKVRVMDNGLTQAEPRVGQTGKVVGFEGDTHALVHFVVDNTKNPIRLDFLEVA